MQGNTKYPSGISITVDKYDCVVDNKTIEQRDLLLGALKGYLHMYGTRTQHNSKCVCWECCMNDCAQRIIDQVDSSRKEGFPP